MFLFLFLLRRFLFIARKPRYGFNTTRRKPVTARDKGNYITYSLFLLQFLYLFLSLLLSCSTRLYAPCKQRFISLSFVLRCSNDLPTLKVEIVLASNIMCHGVSSTSVIPREALKLCNVAVILTILPGGGGHSLIWAIRGRAAGQGMVFWPRCPKQVIQFVLPLPYTGSEPVQNRVWYILRAERI